MDRDKWKLQMRILRKLKRTKPEALRRLHSQKFAGTPWYIKLPRWMDKQTVIRRLFYLYCLQNYHYDDDTAIYQHFKKKAERFLSPSNLVEVRKEAQSLRQLYDFERFTKRSIKAMPINQVDRYLAALDRYIEADQPTRRKVLWQMFNRPQRQHIEDKMRRGRPRQRTNGRLNNKYVIRDLILTNPEMTYDEFWTTYGPVMPTVSRGSFTHARYLLRKAGYNMEYLKPGPSQPVVEEDDDGKLNAGRLDSTK